MLLYLDERSAKRYQLCGLLSIYPPDVLHIPDKGEFVKARLLPPSGDRRLGGRSLEGHGVRQWETGVEYAGDRWEGRTSTDDRNKYQNISRERTSDICRRKIKKSAPRRSEIIMMETLLLVPWLDERGTAVMGKIGGYLN